MADANDGPASPAPAVVDEDAPKVERRPHLVDTVTAPIHHYEGHMGADH